MDQALLIKKMERFIFLAEEAYSSLYDIPSATGRAAAYNECKECMAEAIHLAQELGLDEKVAELDKKLGHYKAVFRHQMS